MKKLLALACAILLVVSPLCAEEVHIDKFKGLYRNPSADVIEVGAHSKFANVYISKNDHISAIKGRTKLNSTAASDTVANGITYYESSTGTTKFVVMESTVLVSYTTAFGSRTSLKSSLTNEKHDFVQVGDTLYMDSATDGLYSWTGSGSAAAVSGVSAPSSVTFSADSAAGGLTPGLDAVVEWAQNGTLTTNQSFVYTTADVIDTNCSTAGQMDTSGDCSTAQNIGLLLINNGNTGSTYSYCVSKYSSTSGIESPCSSVTTVSLRGRRKVVARITGGASYDSRTVEIVGASGFPETATTGTLASAPSAPFDGFRVYRGAVNNSSDFFLVGYKTTGTFTDGKPDTALSVPLDTTISAITPPAGRYIEAYKGSLFVANGSTLRFSHLPVDVYSGADTYWLESDKIPAGAPGYVITGLKSTSNSLLVFSSNDIKELTGFGASSFHLKTLITGIGAVSDETVESDNNGDIILFAGASGVYKLRTFEQPQDDLNGTVIDAPRVKLQRISSPALDSVFAGTDSQISLSTSDYATSHAYYDKQLDLYHLYIGTNEFIYDNVHQSWSWVPGTDMKTSVYAGGTTQFGLPTVQDGYGYFYQDWKTYAMGHTSGTLTGAPTSSTSTSLTDSGASFTTSSGGLTGQWVCLDNGTSLQYRQISSNTGTALTTTPAWTTNPTTSDTYYIDYIIPDILTKQFNQNLPHELSAQSIVLVHNKAASSQTMKVFYFVDQGTTTVPASTPTIDLTTNFVDKVGTDFRGKWLQWGFRTFISNSSDTIVSPLDIINYTVDVTERRNE